MRMKTKMEMIIGMKREIKEDKKKENLNKNGDRNKNRIRIQNGRKEVRKKL